VSGGEKTKTTEEEEEEEEQGDEEVDCFFFLCFVVFFCGCCCGALCVESEEYNLPAGEKLALSFFVSLFYKVLSLLLLRGRKERSVVVSFFLSVALWKSEWAEQWRLVQQLRSKEEKEAEKQLRSKEEKEAEKQLRSKEEKEAESWLLLPLP
jgi:hypothetical protein